MKTTIRGASVRDVSVILDVAVDLSLYFTEEKHHSYIMKVILNTQK